MLRLGGQHLIEFRAVLPHAIQQGQGKLHRRRLAVQALAQEVRDGGGFDLRIQIVLIQELHNDLAGLAAEGHAGCGLWVAGYGSRDTGHGMRVTRLVKALDDATRILRPVTRISYQGSFFSKFAISNAASAHSIPLLPTLPPSR